MSVRPGCAFRAKVVRGDMGLIDGNEVERTKGVAPGENPLHADLPVVIDQTVEVASVRRPW